MIKQIVIEPHQENCSHSFEVKYPGILERCVKCKIYKWVWAQYVSGKSEVEVGKPGAWKHKELEIIEPDNRPVPIQLSARYRPPVEEVEKWAAEELILCDECNTMKHPDHEVDGLNICARCWPGYAEENGLCESCGSELEPIYENNGFTEPEGPSKWEVTGYKPCAQCHAPEYNGDEDL